MKSHLYLTAIAAATLLASASCSDDDSPQLAGEMTTLTVELPQADSPTRFGEGVTAKNLFVAITEAGKQEILFSNFTGGDKKTMEVSPFTQVDGKSVATVSVKLVKNLKYDIYLWAQSYGTTDGTTGPYTWNPTDKTISIRYTDVSDAAEMTAYCEERDAFFAKETAIESTGTSKTITLYRPFAQINVGTDDVSQFEAAGGTGDYGISIDKVANVLNLSTGLPDATSELQTVKVAAAASPAQQTEGMKSFPFQPAKYRYLAMAYVLPGHSSTKKSNVDVYLNADNKTGFAQYSQVPIEMNFRTNIYGSLLTNPDEFNVTIEPAFAGIIDVPWDGKTLKPVTPSYENVDGGSHLVYAVNEAAELAWIASAINSGTIPRNSYIYLKQDIDLSDYSWTPISDFTENDSDKWFTGIFNGDNHKIYGLNCTNTAEGHTAGLIGVAGGIAAVKDVYLKSGTVKSTGSAGALIGMAKGTISVLDCTANGVSVSGEVAGGVVGRAAGEELTMKSSKNYDGAVTATEAAGGVVGSLDSGETRGLQACFNDGTVKGGKTAGGIIGYVRNPAQISMRRCTNQGDIGSGNELYSGGIIGYSESSYLIIEDSPNNGVVKGVVAGGNVGGCIGICHIEYGENRGNIEGSSIAGGMVGKSSSRIDFSICRNYGYVTAIGPNAIAGGIAGTSGESTYINMCHVHREVTATGTNSIAGGVIGKSEATNSFGTYLNDNSVLQNPITASVAGRHIGMMGKAILSLSDSENPDYEKGYRTVGAFIPGISEGALFVMSGTLYGVPAVGTGYKSIQIEIRQNAGWNEFPGETGVFSVGPDGQFHKQN